MPINNEIDQDSISKFIQTEALVREISEIIYKKIETSLYNTQGEDYSILINRLNVVGLSTLDEIKKDLEKHKNKIIKFTEKWINDSDYPNYGFTSYNVPLMYLCYIKLALLGNVADIADKLQLFLFNIDNKESIELAQRILKIYRNIK
ncbi:hypothetical protein [Nostoc sp.]|uniref:hypothetical protein n=1 Tax=Nostoc sp. TaxID=1180 RepID=UPI002FF5A153